MRKVWILLLVCVIIFSGCAKVEEPAELQEASVQLKWVHQAQFAGNYVAKEKGFYAANGLAVELIPFSFDDPTIESVVNGKVDFGITSATELIQAREQGHPLVAFAVIYKISPDCAYSLKESGITKPQDFVGKTIGIEPGVSGEGLYYVMMERLGIDRDNINEVYIGYDSTELLDGSTDVSLGYSINEPHQAIEAGYEVNVMLMAEYGVDVYADVLFATEDTINNKPELVESFLRATLQGWQYAIENEEEAVDYVLKYATDRTRSHESYMLHQSVPLVNTGDSELGMMNKQEWEKAEKILVDQNILKEDIEIEEIYTLEFLEKIYGEG